MASLTFKTASFLIKLPVVQIEWDAGTEKLWFKLYGVQYHERMYLIGVLKNSIPHLHGTNDPSCCHAVDVIIDEFDPLGQEQMIEFRRFSWSELKHDEHYLWCQGHYRHGEE